MTKMVTYVLTEATYVASVGGMDHIRARVAAAVRGLGAERLKGATDVAEVIGCSRKAARLRWLGKRDYLALDLEALLVAWDIEPELLRRRMDEAPIEAGEPAQHEEAAVS
jgi:hypothetical protein